ncbi:hypothetical protein TRFO_29291 [Tritrichomonas foetus]|uniref:Uncharacterized protein n=1 Tax=Tritrichomonas foetus TaxID=1144522 RepID=A0A1J4JWE3_9EUKA|nr:hypothetical protein TRFO_29291 [Tritrichomonas foetus]|eukprot:OHT03315.1 hypothetical protein TRFO_29291 [Tritrichomonas foetus]
MSCNGHLYIEKFIFTNNQIIFGRIYQNISLILNKKFFINVLLSYSLFLPTGFYSDKMLPKRKTPKQPAQAAPPPKPTEGNMVSIVELLQNQIEEERKNVRNKSSHSSARQQRPNAMPPRQLLQKKKANANNPNKPSVKEYAMAELPKPQKTELEELPPPSENVKSMKVASPTREPPAKVTHAEMTSMAVGESEPEPKKMQPTGFTYFDMLNEKSIFLDPCEHF